jgi:hypothetical protein
VAETDRTPPSNKKYFIQHGKISGKNHYLVPYFIVLDDFRDPLRPGFKVACTGNGRSLSSRQLHTQSLLIAIYLATRNDA